MTLTSPFCPFADELIAQIESTIEGLGFLDVRVELTFDPPWGPVRAFAKRLVFKQQKTPAKLRSFFLLYCLYFVAWSANPASMICFTAW